MKIIYKLKRSLRNYLRKRVLKGNTKECNLCGFKSLVFLPYLGKRENAQCISCGSLERNRLLFSYIKAETNILRDNLTLLHVAPDKNTFSRLKENNNLNYYYCDKFEKGYTDAYPKGTLNLDITNLTFFEDNTFDFIICSHVLEHVPDDRKALNEFYRILKPDGIALIMIPWDKDLAITYEDPSITDPLERRKHFGQSDHVRIYGYDFKERIKATKFNLETVNYFNHFKPNESHKYGFKNEEIFVCN